MAKEFKTLPDKLIDRIACLTPSNVNGLKTQIHLINKPFHDDECTSIFDSVDCFTYLANMCKVTGLVKFHKINLLPTQSLIDESLEKTNPLQKIKYVYDSALDNGWTKADINYDAIVHGLIIASLNRNLYDNKICEELYYIYTNLIIIVCDYYGDQHIGWYLFNENLDEPMYYTNKTT